MPKYTNFYETVKEAEIRLLHTVILYDGEPYYVLAITDHKADGIFRIYMVPTGGVALLHQIEHIPYDYPSNEKGQVLDKWLEDNPNKGLIRKMMNSPLFNRFRPFPLGMCNHNGIAVYLERTPQRHTQQGLTSEMISRIPIVLSTELFTRTSMGFNWSGKEVKDTITGVYPSASECLDNLLNPKIINQSAAFNREFAFVRGPLDTLFLSYKTETIGLLPDRSLSSIQLGRKFKFCAEVVERLGVFNNITVQ